MPRGQLRPVVAAHRLGVTPARPDDPDEHLDDLIGVDSSLGLHRQRLAGELVRGEHEVELIRSAHPVVAGVAAERMVRHVGEIPERKCDIRRGRRSVA